MTVAVAPLTRRLCAFDRTDDLLTGYAHRKKVDVLDDDHFVVFFDEQRVVEHVLDLFVVSRREVLQRGGDALGRLRQPLALRVLAQLLQQLLDQLLDHVSSPRYSNRFFAVSTTVTRDSRPVGSPGASACQKARARLSPVVITPAKAGASSSLAWSTC